jgi:dTDP-4-amino-4,6-dideoxygalactose transaminase
LDELQAGFLRVKLRKLDQKNKTYQKYAKLYSDLLAGIGDIRIPTIREGASHIYHQYVIRTRKRNVLLSYLNKHSIPALIHYPIPIHKQPCYPAYHRLSFPNTERACKEILSLPIHASMTVDEIVYIAKMVKQFFLSV